LSPDRAIDRVLDPALGRDVVVDKRRHIPWIANVKFHVDDVVGLGTFFEIEAIDREGHLGEARLRKQCEHYRALIGIEEETFTKPALYKLTLAGTTATTNPVLAGNATALDAVTGKASTLNLSDPDSTETVPAGAARFAGDLLLDSQGDSQQVYLARPGTAQQKAVVLNLGTQVNDTAFASAATGTLYVTDNANNSLVAIKGRFTPGEAMVAAPADSTVHGFVGRLDLATGHIAPFAVGFGSPAGLLFMPGH